MSAETTKLDVKAVLGSAETTCFAIGLKETAADLRAARAAVAELIEAIDVLPSPKFAQVITFEGADYILVAPDHYEAIFEAQARIGGAE